MSTTTASGMTVIHSEDEIPVLATEQEEAEFWATHSLSPELIDRAEPLLDGELPPPRPRTRPTAVRFEEHVLQRLKALAAKKGTGYQTLLKNFVLERLYEEAKRAVPVGDQETLLPDMYRFEQFRREVALLAQRMQEQFGAVARHAADQRSILDADVRVPIMAAYDALRGLFAQVRALDAPTGLGAAREMLMEGVDRYDEVAGNCLTAAGLMDRGELRQGLDIWKRSQPLEDEAHAMVREAARRLQEA